MSEERSPHDSPLSEVEQAALAWWRSKRPAMWEEDDHLQIPRVNTSSEAEADLAWAVSGLLSKEVIP